uniref:Phosphoprotein n=1 Tax=avian paramyxovirus 6 TaxID=2560316 RepID=A0A8E5N8D8_9MONO|nr:phosphoprotein [Avian metaavulavirus 6]UQT69557.1 phosphoprotein [Avian metaavulavirus 6]
MDFSNDQEIAELLELSSDVIKSIQHAETQPAHTVGKSAIRKGNTSELRAAWEAEAQPAQVENKPESHPEQAAQDHDSKIDKEGPQCRSNADGTPQPDEHSGQVTAPPPDTTIGVNGTNGLEAALKKLEKQGKGPGKGQMDRHTSQRDSNTVPGSKKGKGGELRNNAPYQGHPQGTSLTLPTQKPSHARLAQQASQEITRHALQPQDSGGTEENSPFTGDTVSAYWLNGATQSVHPSHLNPEHSNVPAGDALGYASTVAMIVETLKFVVSRLEALENRVTELTKFVSPIQQIKADMQIVKTSCAVIEGQLATVQILEPGHASIRSLEEMKQYTKPGVVVQAGTTRDVGAIMRDGMIVKDALARPVNPDKWSATINTQSTTTKVTQEDIKTVYTLLDNFGITGPKRAKIEAELANVSDRDTLVRIKKRVMNA